MATVNDVYTLARALLNDSSIELYLNGPLLTFTKSAYGDLQRELQDNGIQTAKEISAAIDIAAGIKTVTEPADFLYPIKLEERQDGSTTDDDWVEMEEREFELDAAQEAELEIWSFRENEIQLRGATTAREIRIHYWKTLATLVDGDTVLGAIDCVDFLAHRVASTAAYVIGGNKERAEVLYTKSQAILEKMLSIAVKENQSLPARRLPFRRGR